MGGLSIVITVYGLSSSGDKRFTIAVRVQLWQGSQIGTGVDMAKVVSTGVKLSGRVLLDGHKHVEVSIIGSVSRQPPEPHRAGIPQSGYPAGGHGHGRWA